MNGFRINTNTSSTNTFRQLTKSRGGLESSLERLSSGLRINRAADDTAGLAISQRMRANIRGLQQSSRNASQAINLVQTAEGGMNEIHSILTRMRELAVQAASDNIGDDDRTNIQAEYVQLRDEISRIATSTEYDGEKLIDGTYNGNAVSYTAAATSQTLTTNGVQEIVVSGSTSTGTYVMADTSSTDGQLTMGNGTTTQTVIFYNAPTSGSTIDINFDDLGIQLKLNDSYDDGDLNATSFVVEGTGDKSFQVGATNATDNQISLSIGNLQASSLGTTSNKLTDANLSTTTNARSAITTIDAAIEDVNDERTVLGAAQNRLNFTISNLDNMSQNLQASESTIRDADFALEISSFTRSQILVQAGTAMLAQANASSQNVLSLL